MTLNFDNHPCFSSTARHEYGRIHLPVAPRCNIQCKFCNRKFDCPNESRPGVSSAILTPVQALTYLGQVLERTPNISVVGIAGPGDPFANAEESMETLRLVRANYPEMMLCVASNGLNVEPYVEELAALKVSHVTLTISAIDPEISAQIYSWVRYQKRIRRGLEAAEILIENQIKALKALKAAGVVVKVNSIIIPGINDDHIETLSEYVAELGADIQNCIPIYPVEGTPFAEIETPDPADVDALRLKAGTYIKQMRHCARCRADAVGLVGQQNDEEIQKLMEQAIQAIVQPVVPYDENKPYVAVATLEGVLVNQHLGDADELTVYQSLDDGFEIVEKRKTPARGTGDKRWQELAQILNDCRSILVSGAGTNPIVVLGAAGLKVDIAEGLIAESLENIYNGLPVRLPVQLKKCGDGCSGDGTGCG